jgi:trans-aconitate 2-methyltransferase
VTTPKWDARDYHRHSAAQKGWALELLAKLALTGGERVLDVGSGDGKVTAEIARLVPRGRVVGVDASADMVRFARELFPATANPNLDFRVMDARSLAFDAEFDVVFSSATLHWVDDHAAVLRGIRRALVPGGRCLLQMGGKGNAEGVMQALGDVCARPRWARFFEGFVFPYAFLDAAAYAQLLANAGLSSKRVELIPKTMRQPGADGLAGWLRTTWMPWGDRIPAEQRDAFQAEVVAEYLARHPIDADGSACVAMMRLEVEAVRPAGDKPTPPVGGVATP